MFKLAVLLSGRGSNLQAIIDAIAAGRLDAQICVVVSNDPEAYGLSRARENNIPDRVLLPADFPLRQSYDAVLADLVSAYDPDLVVLAGYMRVLTPAFLDRFPLRVVNIHPALLPSFPGLHAQRQALDYGVKVAGCTVHFVDGGTDTGPIIAQRVVAVADDDDEHRLSQRILAEEHQLYAQVLQWAAQGRLAVSGRRVTILPPAAGADY